MTVNFERWEEKKSRSKGKVMNITGDLAVQISALNDLYFFIGLFLGLIISGIIKHILNTLVHRINRPTRIKHGNLNGRLERKTDFEYLYLVKDRYYTLDQRDFLNQQSKTNRSISPFTFFFVMSPILIAALLVASSIAQKMLEEIL